MDNKTRTYESSYNELVVNNYPKALESFGAGLKAYPKHTPFLHGIVISYILTGEIKNLEAFLEAEKPVSPHRALIESIHMYLLDNKLFDSKPIDVLYNIASFIREQISAADARAYFSIGHIIEPSHQPCLIAMAEYNILEGKYSKGLKLYTQAAKAGNKDIFSILDKISEKTPPGGA